LAAASPAKQTSDQTLIERIAAGDQRAMQQLYARHSVRVYRFVLRLIRNEASAEDVVSEVFFQVWRNAGEFEARSEVSTWLLAIARYKALSMLRVRTYEQLDEEAASEIVDESDDPEVAMQKSERSAMLHRCLKTLTPAHREVIDLVYYHGKSVAEVGEIIGASPSTVKTRMFYARKQLAQLMSSDR